jgi:hypothetical protein
MKKATIIGLVMFFGSIILGFGWSFLMLSLDVQNELLTEFPMVIFFMVGFAGGALLIASPFIKDPIKKSGKSQLHDNIPIKLCFGSGIATLIFGFLGSERNIIWGSLFGTIAIIAGIKGLKNIKTIKEEKDKWLLVSGLVFGVIGIILLVYPVIRAYMLR